MMGLPELETAARLRLPILFVVYDDAAYGAEVHHFRPMGHPVETVQFPDADFAAIARGAGCRGPDGPPLADLEPVRGVARAPRAPAARRRQGEPRRRRGMARGGLPRRLTTSQTREESRNVHHRFRPAVARRRARHGDVRVVDLTQPLHEKTPVLKLPEPFANTPGLTRHEISRYDDRGPAWAWSWLEIGEHVGTHFDAPIHWITGKDGEDVASVPPERLVGPAVMIDKSAEAAADPDYLLTRRRRARVRGRARRAARRAAGCCCAPAGTRAPTTRRRS